MLNQSCPKKMPKFFRLFSLWATIYFLLSSVFIISAYGDEEGILYTDTIIHEDMTWSGNIAIRGIFVVGRGATLTIKPGTIIRFHKIDTNNDHIGDSEIRVLGRLLAGGTKEKPITFQSAEKNPKPKDWSYVLIFSSAEKNFLKYCYFRDAFSGLQVQFSTATVSDSVFTHNNEGIRFGRAKITMSHNLVKNNNLGVRFTRMEGPVEITNNIITQNRVGVILVPSNQNIVDFFEPGRTGKPWNEGHLLIESNNIFENIDYNLNLGTKQKWDLAIKGNWWGTGQSNLIQEQIFDKLRDIELGKAIYKPFLEKPLATAGPR